jgi:hypothetical protein
VISLCIADVLDAHRLLSLAALADPPMEIVQAKAWLSGMEPLDDAVLDGGDGEGLVAAAIAASGIPEIYAALQRELRLETPRRDLEEKLVEWFNDLMPDLELWDLEYLAYGIPAVGFGFDYEIDPDIWTPVLEALQIYQDGEYFSISGSEVIKFYARLLLASDLIGDEDAFDIERAAGGAGWPRAQVGTLIRYLVGATGNTAADMTTFAIQESGMEWMEWNEQNVDFMNYMNEEALLLCKIARDGRDFLLDNPAWLTALADNMERLDKEMPNDPNTARRYHPACPFEWPEAGPAPGGADPRPDPDVLPPRGDPEARR